MIMNMVTGGRFYYTLGVNQGHRKKGTANMGNIYGYVRVSSREQNEERQIIAMREM